MRRIEGSLLNPIPDPTPESDLPDLRSLQMADLSALINANGNLDGSQKGRLIDLLSKYRKCFTGRPGKCNVFEYQFRVNEDRPIVGYSRPIPFAVRRAVRNQIKQMLQDDILEYSDSPFLNPLTVVSKEGKKIRICVDARKINQHTVPDRERTPHFKSYYKGSKARNL
jgi:hypothetical protein